MSAKVSGSTKQRRTAKQQIIDWTPEMQFSPEQWRRRELIQSAHGSVRGGDDRDRIDAVNAALTRQGLPTSTRAEINEVMDQVYRKQQNEGLLAQAASQEARSLLVLKQRRGIILTALRESRERSNGVRNPFKELEAVNLALSQRGHTHLNAPTDLARELRRSEPQSEGALGQAVFGEQVDIRRHRPEAGWVTEPGARTNDRAEVRDRRRMVQQSWKYLWSELGRPPQEPDLQRLLDLVNIETEAGSAIGLDLLLEDLDELGCHAERVDVEDNPNIVDWDPEMTEVDVVDAVEEALAAAQPDAPSGASAKPGRQSY